MNVVEPIRSKTELRKVEKILKKEIFVIMYFLLSEQIADLEFRIF